MRVRERSVSRAGLFFVALVAAIGWTPSSLRAGLPPDSWGGSASVGYDTRPGLSIADVDPLTGTGNGRYWFAEPDDLLGVASLWARWKFSSFYDRARLKLSYERNQWANGEILATDELGADLRQRLPGGTQLQVDVAFLPQVYVRHRGDKDAAPGAPRFRPESYQQTETELAFSKAWDAALQKVALFGTFEYRDENRWFNERDRTQRGGGVSADVSFVGSSKLSPSYEFNVTKSRNKPDLGSDLSHDQHILGIRAQQSIPVASRDVRVDLSMRWKFRSYRTKDVTDDRRFGREDRIWEWTSKVSWRRDRYSPFVAFNTNGRSVNLPIADVASDDGEVDRVLFRLGVDWVFEN